MDSRFFFPIQNNSIINKSVHKPFLLFCNVSLEMIPRNEIPAVEGMTSFNVPICQENSEGIWRRGSYLQILSLQPSFLPLFQEEVEEEGRD